MNKRDALIKGAEMFNLLLEKFNKSELPDFYPNNSDLTLALYAKVLGMILSHFKEVLRGFGGESILIPEMFSGTQYSGRGVFGVSGDVEHFNPSEFEFEEYMRDTLFNGNGGIMDSSRIEKAASATAVFSIGGCEDWTEVQSCIMSTPELEGTDIDHIVDNICSARIKGSDRVDENLLDEDSRKLFDALVADQFSDFKDPKETVRSVIYELAELFCEQYEGASYCYTYHEIKGLSLGRWLLSHRKEYTADKEIFDCLITMLQTLKRAGRYQPWCLGDSVVRVGDSYILTKATGYSADGYGDSLLCDFTDTLPAQVIYELYPIYLGYVQDKYGIEL